MPVFIYTVIYEELWNLDEVSFKVLSIDNYSYVNPYQPKVSFYIENIHLIFSPNQIAGFYMKCNIGLKWVKVVESGN